MLNSIIIMGRLTKDPELRMTQTQKQVVSFSLAVERDYAPSGEKKEVDFIDCVAWDKTAEFIHQYFAKGSMAVAQGRLQFRSWLDKDEKTHNRAEVVVERIYFGDSKKKEDDADPKVFVRYDKSKLTDLVDDGELPF